MSEENSGRLGISRLEAIAGGGDIHCSALLQSRKVSPVYAPNWHRTMTPIS